MSEERWGTAVPGACSQAVEVLSVELGGSSSASLQATNTGRSADWEDAKSVALIPHVEGAGGPVAGVGLCVPPAVVHTSRWLKWPGTSRSFELEVPDSGDLIPRGEGAGGPAAGACGWEYCSVTRRQSPVPTSAPGCCTGGGEEVGSLPTASVSSSQERRRASIGQFAGHGEVSGGAAVVSPFVTRYAAAEVNTSRSSDWAVAKSVDLIPHAEGSGGPVAGADLWGVCSSQWWSSSSSAVATQGSPVVPRFAADEVNTSR